LPRKDDRERKKRSPLFQIYADPSTNRLTACKEKPDPSTKDKSKAKEKDEEPSNAMVGNPDFSFSSHTFPPLFLDSFLSGRPNHLGEVRLRASPRSVKADIVAGSRRRKRAT
jgi:hypothetical protein